MTSVKRLAFLCKGGVCISNLSPNENSFILFIHSGMLIVLIVCQTQMMLLPHRRQFGLTELICGMMEMGDFESGEERPFN